MLRRALCFVSAVLLPALAACGDSDGAPSTEPAGKAKSELDVIGLAARPASLVVLSNTTDAAGRSRFERTLGRVGGAVLATLPPRLVVAQLPDRAEALLSQLGVVARFDRAVLPGEIPSETLAESRFAAVYSNRWHPAGVAATSRIAAHRAPAQPNQPFEGPPQVVERPAGLVAADADDTTSTPYASGTVVVSVVLPESNGTIDPSTEDWSEERIREAYLKVQAALDRIAESEPNANLRFVMHFESAPAAGGLAGTVDTDYEFGRRVETSNNQDEPLATADLLSAILGRPITPDQTTAATNEYQLSLRRRYGADAAFFVIVAPNHHGTAGFRARAHINGPRARLDSSHGTSVFMHEFGHIFGAQDEYCQDMCASPVSLQGYIRIYNANATHREGDSGGINGGQGENAPSLMGDATEMGAVNGYTRGAWGWLDRDGDGIIEVRDTFPESQLQASVSGQTVRLTGQVVDRPLLLGVSGYSVNHLSSLEVEIEHGGTVLDTIDVSLPGDVRGYQPVDVSLPPLPQGEYVLRARAKNEVGNVEFRPFVMNVTIGATGNTAPIPHLTLPDAKAVSSAQSWSIQASAVDLEGDVPEVRIDLGADGTFDTPWGAPRSLDVRPAPGIYPIVVEARDPSGAIASTRRELLVFEGNAPPAVRLDPVPSLVHGTSSAVLDLMVAASDPEGGPLDYSWIAELATNDGPPFRKATGWGASNRFSVELPTPGRLASQSLHLGAGDANLEHYRVGDLLPVGPSTVAVAGGWSGVWFLDLADPAAPVIVSRIPLETSASRLWRDQNRLYVLGSKLTVVDISDLRSPTEIRQLTATNALVTASSAEVLAIGDGVGASHVHYVEGDRIQGSTIRVTTSHNRPADLRVVLHPPRPTGLAPITLRDKVAAPRGQNTWTFTDANTPALAALRGLPATDDWTIEVVDDVANGVVGSLRSSKLDFQTRSYAASVLPAANEIAGKLPSGDLVVAGRGIQVLSVTAPASIRERSRIDGFPSVGASLQGSSLLMATRLKDTGTKPLIDPLEGIVAVDLSVPTTPHVVRRVIPVEDPAKARRVGSRVYVQVNPTCETGTPGCEDPKPATLVIDPAGFASGAASWQLGRSPLLVDGSAFGDDQALWTVGNQGYVQRYDVADPANLRVASAYPANRALGLVPIGPLSEGSDLLLFDGSLRANLADRDRVTHVLSRVYHLTVEARDAAGAVTRASRTVHVNPYDHAPTASRVDRIEGSHPGESHVFNVFASDPDGSEIWNPRLYVRVDWDGDGTVDTGWTTMPATGTTPARISKVFEQAGTYQAVFEVRDGYYATHRLSHTIVVQ